MKTNASIQPYTRLYSKLIHFYPQPFQQRFSESMLQTFNDLCRERQASNQAILGFSLWIFSETVIAIVRENTTHMSQLNKTIFRAALMALGLLMVPLVASQFIEGWHWGVGGFVFAYTMFFITSLAYGLISRAMGVWAYKAGVGLALAAGFVLGWGNMVRMTESENPAHLVYFGVLVLGGVGAWLVRLQPQGMARALFAMAAVLAFIGIVAIALSTNLPSSELLEMAVRHAVFVALFTTSGFLFRHASLAESK